MGRNDLGAKHPGGQNDLGGNDQGVSRLGEEMAWGRNDSEAHNVLCVFNLINRSKMISSLQVYTNI